MSNLTNNRINTTATPAQVTAVKTAFQTIATNLPFLIGLTKEERSSLPAIDVNNKAFTEDAINIGVNNASLFPAYLSVANMQNDLTLFSQMDEILFIAKQLVEKIEDTQLLSGSEAYTNGLMLYKLIGASADAGVPGADTLYDQLKTRFTNQGGKGTPPVDPGV
jgi:hypothetical protein